MIKSANKTFKKIFLKNIKKGMSNNNKLYADFKSDKKDGKQFLYSSEYYGHEKKIEKLQIFFSFLLLTFLDKLFLQFNILHLLIP